MSDYLDRSKAMLFKKSVDFAYSKQEKYRKKPFFSADQNIARKIKEYDKGHRLGQNWHNILKETKFRSKEELFDYFRLRIRKDQLNANRQSEVIFIINAASYSSTYLLELLKNGKFDMKKNSSILDRRYASMLYYRLLGEFLLEKLSAYPEFVDETERIETILYNYDYGIFKSILESFLLSIIQLTENHLKSNKTAFEMMINTNKELTEKLDNKSDHMKTEIVKELYLSLNNMQTDFLLDKISVYANLLQDKDYLIQNIEARILLHHLLTAFESLGMEKMGEIGEEVVVRSEEEKENYFCVDGLTENTIYQIIKPGWKIGDQVLKMTEVKQVKQEGV